VIASVPGADRFAPLIQGEWMMANVRDGNVFVEPADVQDALSEMLGLSYRLPAGHNALRANACTWHT